MTGPKYLIRAARFSPDGKKLLSGSTDGVLAEWEVGSGRRLQVLLYPIGNGERLPGPFPSGIVQSESSFPEGHPTEVIRGCSIADVCYSSDGKRAYAIAANGHVAAWDAARGEALHSWRAHGEKALVVEVSPDGHWLATGSKESGSMTLRVWRISESQTTPPGEAFSSELMVGGVFSLAFSRDSLFLASGGWGNSGYSAPMIFDLASGERVSTLLFDASRAIAYSPDGKLLATGDEEGKVSIWDLASRSRIFEKNVHDTIVSVIKFSPDGRLFVSGSYDGGLKIWDLTSGGLRREDTFAGIVLSCRFSTDSRNLAIAIGTKDAERPGIHHLFFPQN